MLLIMRDACSVKPAIFDLFLAFAIAIYLAFVYLILNVVSLYVAGVYVCVCMYMCICICKYHNMLVETVLACPVIS